MAKKQQLLEQLQQSFGDDFNPVVKIATNATTIQEALNDGIEYYKLLNTGTVEQLVMHDLDPDPELIDKLKHTAKGQIIKLAREANTEWDRVAKYVTPTLKSAEVAVNGHLSAATRELTAEELKQINDELETEY